MCWKTARTFDYHLNMVRHGTAFRCVECICVSLWDHAPSPLPQPLRHHRTTILVHLCASPSIGWFFIDSWQVFQQLLAVVGADLYALGSAFSMMLVVRQTAIAIWKGRDFGDGPWDSYIFPNDTSRFQCFPNNIPVKSGSGLPNHNFTTTDFHVGKGRVCGGEKKRRTDERKKREEKRSETKRRVE